MAESPGTPRTPGGTVIANKPVMIYLHPNTSTYEASAGMSLAVNLSTLESFEQLLDDCTARMKMQFFADKIFTPAGDRIQDLDNVQPRSHVIVVPQNESLRLQHVANTAADEPFGTDSVPERRALTPPRVTPASRALAPEARAKPKADPATQPATEPASTQALSPSSAPISEVSEQSETFKKYDLNADGVLDKDEVCNMMQLLGYKTDHEYLENIMEAFESFDDDKSGVIEPHEFELLYAHLGGSPGTGAENHRPWATDKQQTDALFTEFQKFDQSNRGYLSQYDVKEMMRSMGYRVTTQYLEEIMVHFANFDSNVDGVIDFEEFKQLYKHLGGTVETASLASTQDDAHYEHLGGELSPSTEAQTNHTDMEMDLEPELEPEPEPEPELEPEPDYEWQLSGGDSLRNSMLSGHTVQDAIAAVQEGSELTIYLPTGKKKHKRFFWVRRSSTDASFQLCWGKKKGTRKYQVETLHEILPEPDIKNAEELFREFDEDCSGHIDAIELQMLYERARGTKLSQSRAKQALEAMDGDSTGMVSLPEFKAWWNMNGGDLQRYKAQAFTIKAGDLTLLLMAERHPWEASRSAWVMGCDEILGSIPRPE